MFRTLSRCLSPIFLRKNMNFQRAILPNITFAPGSHSRAYSTPSPPEPSHNDQPSQQRGDPFWGVIREYMVKPYEREIDAEALWRRKSLNVQASLEEYPPANPYTGRSVKVINGNVADAYRRLDSILARNRVKYELRLAERHEKKGAKRRRLKSERWRIRFADEVRKKVMLVKAIRRRGS